MHILAYNKPTEIHEKNISYIVFNFKHKLSTEDTSKHVKHDLHYLMKIWMPIISTVDSIKHNPATAIAYIFP